MNMDVAKRRQVDKNCVVNFRDKIIAWDKLPAWRAAFRATGKKLVVTNGCFDILHLGHVSYLESARNLGDALLVGINGDAAARQLKGPGRPVNSEADRAAVLAALASVDGVCIFADKTATKFLSAAKPDIYVKGGDYTLDTLNQEERRAGRIGGRKNCDSSAGARQIHNGVAGKNFAIVRNHETHEMTRKKRCAGGYVFCIPFVCFAVFRGFI